MVSAPSQPEPGGRLVIVVRQLRRDFEGAEQNGARHTVQRLMPECSAVVTVVAARPDAGVAGDPWVTTRASPWADLSGHLRGKIENAQHQNWRVGLI